MPDEKLISVIVPVYNVMPYLERCVTSITEQKHKNTEIILVDDGSTDGSGEACDRYAATDDRIKVIHKPNGGQSTARNAALKICKGEYIAFVDSDDYIAAEYLSFMLKEMEKSSCDIVQSGYKEVYALEKEADSGFPEQIVSLCKTSRDALLSQDYKVAPWGKLYKKKLFEGLFFPEGIVFEDEALYYKVLYRCNKVLFADVPLYYYYQSDNSTMRNKSTALKTDFIGVCRERNEFFEKTGDKTLCGMSYYRFLWTIVLNHALCKKKKLSKENGIMLKKLFRENRRSFGDYTPPLSRRIILTAYRFAPDITAKILASVRG